MEPIEVKLARVEESLRGVHGKLDAIAKLNERVYKHDTQIALLQRDKKWEKHIGNTISGILGGALYAFFDWMKK